MSTRAKEPKRATKRLRATEQGARSDGATEGDQRGSTKGKKRAVSKGAGAKRDALLKRAWEKLQRLNDAQIAAVASVASVHAGNTHPADDPLTPASYDPDEWPKVVYRDALPFGIHTASDADVNEAASPFDLTNDDRVAWSDRVAELADEALERGYALSVLCRPEYAVQVTAFMVQQVTRDVWAEFDREKMRILLWDREPRTESKDSCRVIIREPQ